MRKGQSNAAKIRREEQELADILGTLPANPINWLTVIRIVAPIVARLAVRYALKRAKRSLSEDKVNAVANQVATLIKGVIDKRVPPTE